MPVTCVIGLQWGDEAKGKIVDLLAEQHDIVVRYQGGSNAGHTVVRQGQTYKLSLVPSGIFRPDVQCVIAAGVVVNPASLVAEIDALAGRGVAVGKNLMISDRAHVIFPWHVEEDRLAEQQCGGEAIGTTLRGIGPCYRDKFGRGLAVRMGDMYRPDFLARIERIANVKNNIFTAFGDSAATKLDSQQIFDQYRVYAERLSPHVADTTAYLLDAAEAGKRMLFEGAKARCWTSTTARSPSSPAATVPAWAPRPVRACPAGSSRRSSASSRHTPRGWAAGRFPPSRTTPPASISAAAATNMAP